MIRARCPHVFIIVVTLLGSGLALAQDDVADVPSKRLSVAGDPNMSYFLIGPTASAVPTAGYGLVVIMPGGAGGPDFHPFVKRIYKHALSPEYVVVQPIAVKWSPRQRVVWPTANDNLAYAKFTTEQFVDAVIKAVQGQHKINPLRIFTLSWSSSGPAAYAISLNKDSPIVGSYVAMSVFKPAQLGSLKGAAGHAYFIDHSPQDKVCPFRMAQEASRLLAAEGAQVTLKTYEGGHGWRGSVYPRISAGVKWLEENARPRQAIQEKEPNPAPKETPSEALLHDSFERSSEWTKGANVEGVEYLWDQNQAYKGKASMCLKKTVNRYLPIAEWRRTIPCSGPTALAVSAWVKAADAKKAIIDIQFIDSAGKAMGHEWAAYIGARQASDPAANHDWRQYEGAVTVPTNTRTIAVALQIYGPGNVWFDELLIRQKSN